ncbi:AbrB family transcriptional regulator [Virgibacillus profundi]|uniref:AbrB family transcriptional regulator n=1 Tax=Virgibacillus profundi TaxID=2024555 RepID=A0A2A2IEK0_9BACI|nr:AbrB/MazE/SpoVT family DNA-binding domain-containing protein [Virgibacillus profundi]PAV29674.1 AbrB family transcriptional regulator [Virgibacillus profundi]PXY53846.1 AbrB/MazE/SpoVT family DNA-binding domain-containing protein [Virgibacillus profundi]
MSKHERKITKIGNSYGITFPKELLKESGLSYGDDIKLELKNGEIVLSKKEEIRLPKGISADFFEVLERNTNKHKETIEELVDR